MARFDTIVIGGGIVGLGCAYQITRRRPSERLLLLEKESSLARHQTGHNSGVLHSGIYYRPGSLKARNCREGKAAMEAFCDAEGIPHETCGKVIVATRQEELPRLEDLLARGKANGVVCASIGPERLAEIEPHAAGIAAIEVPETGITDYVQVADRLAARIREAGGEIRAGARVTALEPVGSAGVTRVAAEGVAEPIEASRVVNCAGLYTDRVTRMAGAEPPARIVPFRGEYYALKEEAHDLVNGLIYPVPDPRFPFLGVHFTRTIHGGVECGPNAVLAFAREGYRKRDVDLHDLLDTLLYPGFWRAARPYLGMGLGEMWRSVSKKAFVKALQRLLPDIRAEHLVPAPAGVRAQAVTREGKMVDDFLIAESGTGTGTDGGPRILHVCNAPSPAATASLAIGEQIADRLFEGD